MTLKETKHDCTTLLPCPNPWCGGVQDKIICEKYNGNYYVTCTRCGNLTPPCCAKNVAVKIWNQRTPTPYDRDKAIELLANLEHEQWAHWTTHLLNNMNQENIRRWWVQVHTPYASLSDTEKESDKVWARKVIDTLEAAGLLSTPTKPVVKGLND